MINFVVYTCQKQCSLSQMFDFWYVHDYRIQKSGKSWQTHDQGTSTLFHEFPLHDSEDAYVML